MVDFRNLETFVWVARLVSFRLAAEKLNMTQPAISARIALLEQELGVRLFDRRRRRVALTTAGEDLLGYAERMLVLHAEMVQAVGSSASLRRVLRLGAPETIVHTWLPGLVERIAAEFPSVTLDVEVDSTPNLRDALVSGKLDIAFLQEPVSDERLISAPLCSFPLGWFASPALALPQANVSLADCTSWPIITFRRSSRPYVAIRQLLTSIGLTKARIFGSSAIAGTLRMALDGIGVCVLPIAVVQAELRENRLRMLPIGHALPPVDFHVGYHRNSEGRLAAIVADLAIRVARSQAGAAGNPSKPSIKQIQKKN